jgi:ATP-binding protein involved in chromosome partitioning
VKSYHDIVGDGGSAVADQVEAQRARIARRLAEVRHVVAIASGKGGVGKSTLTAALARRLAAAGRTVAVLDADLNGPCQARLAGLAEVPVVPQSDALAPLRGAGGVGVVSLGALLAPGAPLEFRGAPAGDSHVWRAAREFTLLAQLLGAVRFGPLDVLLVDLPPGAERTVHYAEFLGPRASFVLISLPAALSREVVARSAAALGRTANRLLGRVDNMCGYACPDCGAVQPLFADVEDEGLTGPLLGTVPFDSALAAAGTADPSAATVRALDELGRRIVAALEGRR